jgi:hypothetical protein
MKTQVNQTVRGDTLADLKAAVVEILKSSVSDLKTSAMTSEGDKFFPKGINFISIDIAFDPTKVNFRAELIISSEPVKKSLDTTDQIMMPGKES